MSEKRRGLGRGLGALIPDASTARSRPVDVFFAESPFHHDVDRRCREVPFAGRTVRVLSAEDLAVFKAMFDRPKDWVDIATMAESNAVDLAVAAERLHALLGDDSRVGRLRAI